VSSSEIMSKSAGEREREGRGHWRGTDYSVSIVCLKGINGVYRVSIVCLSCVSSVSPVCLQCVYRVSPVCLILCLNGRGCWRGKEQKT